ncbi:ATP-binding protein [Candidatus Woesebacteria bacterium]|nr:ATP-binding protein [Candidatus Woesebacteria bacterium]
MRLCIQWLLSLPVWRTAFSFVTISQQSSESPLGMSVFQHACATPLTTLLLDTDSLLTSEQHDPQTVNRMKISVLRLRELFQSVSGVLSEQFQIYDAVQEVHKMLGSSAAFSICCSPEVRRAALISGSKLLFTECLVCIVKNAVESYPEGVVKQVEIAITLHCNSICVTISDYGRGMNPVEQFMARIKGVSCHKHSTGLGVPFAVRTIREYFSGSVRLESALGVGTKVHIVVPIK